MEVRNGSDAPAVPEAGAGRGAGRGRGMRASGGGRGAVGGRGFHTLQKSTESKVDKSEAATALSLKKAKLQRELEKIEKAEKRIAENKDATENKRHAWKSAEGSKEREIDRIRDKKLKKAATPGTAAPPQKQSQSDKVMSKEAIAAFASARAKLGEGVYVDQQLSEANVGFNKLLRAVWKTVSKEDRKQLQSESDAMRSDRKVKKAVLPFTADAMDHLETSPEAFADVAPLLELLAEKLGKAASKVEVWDPYYCSGASKRHLAALGFKKVHNECEDFYSILEKDAAPTHDVVLTSPPSKKPANGEEHVPRLFKALKEEGKPFLLCMPESTASADFYCEAFPDKKDAPLLICPYKRYHFWTPEGMRNAKSSSHRRAGLGIKSSPFVALWYVNLEPVISNKELIKLAKAGSLRGIDTFEGGAGAEPVADDATTAPKCRLCKKVESLPSGRADFKEKQEKGEKMEEASDDEAEDKSSEKKENPKKRTNSGVDAPANKKQKVEAAGGAVAAVPKKEQVQPAKQAPEGTNSRTKRGGKKKRESREKAAAAAAAAAAA